MKNNKSLSLAILTALVSFSMAHASDSPADAVASTADGEKTYKAVCFACHDTGVANAPKLGDKAAWAPRIATGKEALYTTALKGKGAMPPKGGRTDLSDDAVKATVDYMISKVEGGDATEKEAPKTEEAPKADEAKETPKTEEAPKADETKAEPKKEEAPKTETK